MFDRVNIEVRISRDLENTLIVRYKLYTRMGAIKCSCGFKFSSIISFFYAYFYYIGFIPLQMYNLYNIFRKLG